MKIDIQRIKKQLGFPSDRPLTLQEKRRYMKFAVYPLFFLIFAGIVLLIYSPTEKEKAEAEKEGIQYRDPVSRREPYGR